MNTVIKRAWNKNKLVKVEDLTGMTFQAESGGHTFEISGVDDAGAAVSLSGTVEGRFLRADNAEIIISGTASGGKASVTLSDVCYAIPGRFLLTIYVTSNGQKVAVYAATGSVVATSGTASGSIPPLVTDSVQANTGTFGSIDTGDATVDGVLDVTKRRCYAYLLQAGWYRVLTFDSNNRVDALGSTGTIIDIYITRRFGSESNEVHKVTLLCRYGSVTFVGEESSANVLEIDQIRWCYETSNTSKGHLDIHYNYSSDNIVSAKFEIATFPGYQQFYSSKNFEAVAPAPSGETELTRYTFAANTYNGMRYYREVVNSITIGSNGFASMTMPSQIVGRKIVNIMVVTFGTLSGGAMFITSYSDASGNARSNCYMAGSPGASMTNVIIEFWYL